MSVVDRMGKGFHFVGAVSKPDGLGGTITEWAFGEAFTAIQRMDNSTQTRVAEQDGFTAIYTMMAEKDLDIQAGDIFFRDFDEQTFRAVSDPNDQLAPDSAQTQIKEFSAELFELPEKPSAYGIEETVERVNYAVEHFPDASNTKTPEKVENVGIQPVEPPQEEPEQIEEPETEEPQEETGEAVPDGQGGVRYV